MALIMKILAISAGSFLTLACIFYIISDVVPIWSRFTDGDLNLSIGLWRSCASSLAGPACSDTCSASNYESNQCTKVSVARAFITLACIFAGISILCLVACAITSDDKYQNLLLATRFLTFLCLAMGIIGVTVGISVTIDIGVGKKLDMGAAAIIGIVALIMNFGGAVVVMFLR